MGTKEQYDDQFLANHRPTAIKALVNYRKSRHLRGIDDRATDLDRSKLG